MIFSVKINEVLQSNPKEGIALAFMSKIRDNTKVILVVAGIILVIGTVAATFAFAGSAGKAPSKYIAEINGIKLERNQFEQDFYYVWQQQNQMSYGQLTGLDQEPMRAQYMMQLLMREALLDEAKNLGLDATKEEIDAEMAQIAEAVGGADELKARLDIIGISEDTLKEDIRNSVIFEKLQDEITKDVDVTDDEVRQQLEEVNASHILVDNEELANELYQKLQDGADFAELAKEYSLDTGSKDDGGALGFFGRGVMISEFEDAAFNLEAGEISEPVRSQFGYHIIKTIEHKVLDDEEFAEKKDEAREKLLLDKKDNVLSQYVSALQAKSKIKIYDSQLRAWFELSEGKIEDAIKSYNEALKDRPGDPYILASLAEAYRRKGDIDTAWDNYRKASAGSNELAIKLNMALIGQTKMQNIVNAKETEEEKSLFEWTLEDEELKAIYADIVKALDEASSSAGEDLLSHLQLAQVFNMFGDTERGQAEMDKIKAITEKIDAEESLDEDADSLENTED